MTENQVLDLAEVNKCMCLEARTLGGEKLAYVCESSPTAAANALRELLPNFKNDYKKINIHGKVNSDTNWSKSFVWLLEFPKEDVKVNGVAISSTPGNGFDFVSYIGMMKEHNKEILTMQKELLDAKIAQANSDPAKWLPLINAIGPALGYHFNNPSAGMAGPNTTTEKPLQFQDNDINKMTDKELMDSINVILEKIAKKITGPQMLKFLIALESNHELKKYIDKITGLMQAIAKNPALVETASQYLK